MQSGVLLGLGLTPFIVHSDLSLQFAVCGNTTIPPFANPGETKEWSDFIFSRLLYFNIGVAALSLLAFIFTLIGELIDISLMIVPMCVLMTAWLYLFYSFPQCPAHSSKHLS